MSVPLARYLKDFGAPQPQPQAQEFVSDFDFADSPFDMPEISSEPEIDIEAEKSKAYAEGHEAATREIAARHEEQLAELATLHRQEMDAQAAKYEEAVAQRVEEFLKQMHVSLAGCVETAVANVLTPFVQDQVARVAAAKFAEDVAEEVGQGRTVKLAITGPETFIDTMRKRLDPLVSEVDYTDAPEIDMKLEVGDTVLVTRLKACVEAMEEQIDE
ncbi:hypothetical protein [Neorhizobium sp. NCHU2750]|uniref:hypothetical protein n=1 Tax=Neorhizobium sp. NCHU2750 TaxID=1825976 RepID=UPI000E759DC4|nr:hypothetical protein NCHU2750_02680 [Neorhizobium sp. NCHU2750]